MKTPLFDGATLKLLDMLELFNKTVSNSSRDMLIDYVFNPLSQRIFHTSTYIIESEEFKNLYSFFTTLAITFIGLVFIWNSFKLIFGKEATPLFPLLIKSIIGIAYLKFVPYLIRTVIEANNLICNKVIEFVGGEDTFDPILSPDFTYFHFIVFTIIFLVYIVRLVFYYFGRDYLIALLTLIAPFMWFFWLEESLQQNVFSWLRYFLILIFTQFVHCIQLAAFSVIMLSLAGRVTGPLQHAEMLIFAIISTAFMVKTPSFLKEFTADIGSGTNTIKNVASFVTFAKERKILSIFKGVKK